MTTRSITTPKSAVAWSVDGATVTKRPVSDYTDEVLGRYRYAVRNEVRINRLLLHEPPPVVVPRLLAWSRGGRAMTFEAVEGEPLGPKFPTALAPDDVTHLIELAAALEPFQPRRRWFRRLDLDRRLRHHVRSGLLAAADAELILTLTRDSRIRWRFAHADLTARNVLRRADGQLVLIDWEWAGLYPAGYELAFLWFSLADVPGGRAAVERVITRRHEAGFLVSALVIQLLHLHLLQRVESPFLPNHRATMRDLLDRLHRR